MSQLVVCYVRNRINNSVVKANFARVPIIGETICLNPGEISRVSDVIHCVFDNTVTIWV